MSENYEAPQLPDNLDETTDTAASDAMQQLVKDRRSKGVMIPRFVKQLNTAGYSITLEEYKRIEKKPFYAIPHVRNGITVYAYRALNKLRVDNSVQDSSTAHAMTLLAYARQKADISYAEMAKRVSDRLGIQVTEAEYRTSEQGMTKTVPWAWVVHASRILGITPGELFQ